MTIHSDGRAGPLDGLPSGQRRAATWLPVRSEDDYCFYQNRHCTPAYSAGLVVVHDMFDAPNGGTVDYSTVVTCVAHAVARRGVHPSGEPTDEYRAAVGGEGVKTPGGVNGAALPKAETSSTL